MDVLLGQIRKEEIISKEDVSCTLYKRCATAS